MNKKILLSVCVVVAVLILCAGFYLLGNMRAVQKMSIVTVSPAQLADAMKGDYFYSNYRENTIIVSGQVGSISNVNGVRQITIKSPSSYQVYCDLAATAPTPAKGTVVTLITEGASAIRQPGGVELVGCTGV
ncbi:MAG TPA: hypothetical protein VIH90_00535 [Candidatus Saccharimonadales bacterium]